MDKNKSSSDIKKEMLQMLENSSMGEKETKAVYSELLNLFSVSGCFTAEDMEDAYRDGYENEHPREWDFNIDNYR